MANPCMRTVFVCAVCGKEKGESNHWYVADQPKGAIMAYYHWDPHRIISDDKALAICGQLCLVRLINQKAGAVGA